MELDSATRNAFLAFAVLLLAAVMVMTFRMDPVGVDRSAAGVTHSPQNAPASPTLLR